MNTSTLIVELSHRLEIPKTKIGELLEGTVSIITQQLNENNTVAIQHFGTFEIKKKEERVNVHPISGKRTLIPPKLTVNYKPSPSLKEKIRGRK